MNTTHPSLADLAIELRRQLDSKDFVLLYAHNSIGKTRLSMSFKDIGIEDNRRDTLYFNAFTEDLFQWDNDLVSDSKRKLVINSESRFFDGISELEMDNRIRPLLERYSDFDFRIDTTDWSISFSRQESVTVPDGIRQVTVDDIKISRGEENIFIWCFFLAILQIRLDDDGTGPYNWVKYVYIDDPISSLDEHNAIIVANHLVELFRESDQRVKTVISTHHNLFFNVIHYELKNHFRGLHNQHVLSKDRTNNTFSLGRQGGDTPAFHHIAALTELKRVATGEQIHTYHFNMLRVILEKTALFHGHGHFSACVKRDAGDSEGILHQRFLDLLSHGKYSMFEPNEMTEETKSYFRRILDRFLESSQFNATLFTDNE